MSDVTTYRLVCDRPSTLAAPDLDASQRRVVEHPGGPLLVLAGPGTGKTTTLVEAVVDRVERRGLSPDQVLVLTYSRKAAADLRDRIAARLGRTTATPLAATFHSFCFGLLRRHQPAEAFVHGLRVLSAAEQDVRIRELLAGTSADDTVTWPTDLRLGLRTRGMAEQVRAVLSRAREIGLDPTDLVAAGHHAGRPEWTAVGVFAEEYLDVLDAEGVIDYAELVHRAVLLARAPSVRAELRAGIAATFVDEYQDTDPAQVALLRELAGDGRDLVVAGDPDQSIYAFRGADVRGITRFPADFADRAGNPAPVVALGTTRRFGERMLVASRRVATALGVPGALDRGSVTALRSLRAEPGDLGDGRVEARTYTSAGAELDGIADLLRRAHLQDALAWSDMAVLVRSGIRSLPQLRRALTLAGVPVEVAGDELVLAAEPAVRPLLQALRVAADPATLTAEVASDLLMSPLGGLDAADVRRLGRLLWQRGPRPGRAGAKNPTPRSSGQLLGAAVADPDRLAGERGAAARRAAALGRLLRRARERLAAGEPPEQALWTLWSGTRWPARLRAAAEAGGPAARSANRDLDAVCALFDTAARAEERSGHRGAAAFLAEVEAQQLPAGTLAEQGVRGDAVRLLTAHRAKGLQWRLVVVAGVQAGVWPDVRRRGGLLEPDRLAGGGLVPPLATSTLLAEERRLFYVAITRARQRLVVTAVASPEADGDQPSRFLRELGVDVGRPGDRVRRPLALAPLIGELRRVVEDESRPVVLRRAAAQRLARLAEARDEGGQPLVPLADPSRWWGLRETTRAPEPVRDRDRPLALSGSALSGLVECPLRWFLSREAAGETTRGGAIGFGSVLHVVADDVAAGRSPADADAAMRQVETVWHQLGYDSAWISDRERAEAHGALGRFVAWHTAAEARELLASERTFELEVSLPHGDLVRLRGAIDRVERDRHGRVWVVDLKTGRRVIATADLAAHPQLGVYQLAVARGALADLTGEAPTVAGGELVQLRVPTPGGRPKVQTQDGLVADADGLTWVERRLVEAARAVRAERFDARPSRACDYCEFRRVCPATHEGRAVVA